MAQHIVKQLDNSVLWSDIHPDLCPCRGRGWLVSDFDTYHRCKMHGEGVAHPEEGGGGGVDMETLYRAAYRHYREAAHKAAGVLGVELGHFGFVVEEKLKSKWGEGRLFTAKEWCDMAREVSGDLVQQSKEAQARAEGFGSGLERELHLELEREREDERESRGVYETFGMKEGRDL